MIHVITRKKELEQYIREQKGSIGFVPTMGALHQGHASLIKLSAEQNNCTVVSIFVNPKQFDKKEDFAHYPRNIQQDKETCELSGAQVLFLPTIEEIYPNNFSTFVNVEKYTDILCGAFRPGHFKGVTTVVMILMNLVKANHLYLGQKDYQQVQVLTRMTSDLCHSTKIITVPTVREADGLAMSSRNQLLSPDARTKAAHIPKALFLIEKAHSEGELSCIKLLQIGLNELKKADFAPPEYFEFRNANNILEKYEENIHGETLVALAQFVQSNEKTVRLIDNIILKNS